MGLFIQGHVGFRVYGIGFRKPLTLNTLNPKLVGSGQVFTGNVNSTPSACELHIMHVYHRYSTITHLQLVHNQLDQHVHILTTVTRARMNL